MHLYDIENKYSQPFIKQKDVYNTAKLTINILHPRKCNINSLTQFPTKKQK